MSLQKKSKETSKHIKIRNQNWIYETLDFTFAEINDFLVDFNICFSGFDLTVPALLKYFEQQGFKAEIGTICFALFRNTNQGKLKVLPNNRVVPS